MRLIETADDWRAFDRTSVRRPVRPRGVLLCPPDHFDIVEVINVHMEGRVGTVDSEAARREWDGLCAAFEELEVVVETLSPVRDLIDLVFTANPCLIGLDRDARPFAVLSRMTHPGRRGEVACHAAFLEQQGIRTVSLPRDPPGSWEGGGDSVWHPGHYLLWGGYGLRSHRPVIEGLAGLLELPIAVLALVDPAFYHLDTCLMPIREHLAAYVPQAFDARGRDLIRAAFADLIEIDIREARERLACNFYCPDGRRVLLPSGSPVTRARLEGAGLEVTEVCTDEFLKSGGSVFCMCQELVGPG